MTWVQCQLGFVGTFLATKRHLSKNFAIKGFLINQEHITFSMGCCAFVGRSKLI